MTDYKPTKAPQRLRFNIAIDQIHQILKEIRNQVHDSRTEDKTEGLYRSMDELETAVGQFGTALDQISEANKLEEIRELDNEEPVDLEKEYGTDTERRDEIKGMNKLIGGHDGK